MVPCAAVRGGRQADAESASASIPARILILRRCYVRLEPAIGSNETWLTHSHNQRALEACRSARRSLDMPLPRDASH